MRISCLQENLQRGLGLVGRAVATRSTLPVTQNVLLRTQEGMLQLTGTNLEMSIQTKIGCMIEEEGAFSVPYRLLADYVGDLPSDRVDLTLEENVLNLKCGRTSLNVNGASADDFPLVTDVGEAIELKLPVGTLRRGINLVEGSVANDESLSLIHI